MGYSFIYAYFCQFFEKLKSSDSKSQANMFTTLTVFFHLLFFFTIFKIITNDYLGRTFGYPSNKYVFAPLVILLMWVIERTLNKYRNSMIKKYETVNLVSIFNSFIVLCVMLVPLVISISLLKKD